MNVYSGFMTEDMRWVHGNLYEQSGATRKRSLTGIPTRLLLVRRGKDTPHQKGDVRGSSRPSQSLSRGSLLGVQASFWWIGLAWSIIERLMYGDTAEAAQDNSPCQKTATHKGKGRLLFHPSHSVCPSWCKHRRPGYEGRAGEISIPIEQQAAESASLSAANP